MSAVLHRAWRGRVKGRDWYDLIWYIQNKVPLNLSYLEACMRQAGHLKPKDLLDGNKLMEMLNAKIQSIDWESAKAEMRSFISDPHKLEIWSPQFFSALIDHLQIEY
jgi:hypothetical protein